MSLPTHIFRNDNVRPLLHLKAISSHILPSQHSSRNQKTERVQTLFLSTLRLFLPQNPIFIVNPNSTKPHQSQPRNASLNQHSRPKNQIPTPPTRKKKRSWPFVSPTTPTPTPSPPLPQPPIQRQARRLHTQTLTQNERQPYPSPHNPRIGGFPPKPYQMLRSPVSGSSQCLALLQRTPLPAVGRRRWRILGLELGFVDCAKY